MSRHSRIVLFLALVLVDFICCSASPTSRCWLDYSQIPYTALPRDLELDYGTTARELGSGTSGSVLLLLRHADNATVAVKRFHNAAEDEDRHDLLTQRIKLEYHLGTLLNGHPGISESFDLLLEEGSLTWFLVTEFCPRSLAKEHRSIGAQSLTEIFRSVVEAVEHMHALGIAHGDLKLENVLLTADGRPKLIDFGAATFSGCPTETPGSADAVNVVPGDYGTTAYMPPDVFTQLEFDKAKADVWALGVLFFAMMTGSVPWSSASIDDPRYQAYVTPQPLDDGFSSHHCPNWDKSTVRFHTCSTGAMHLLQRLPANARDMVASMLVPEPQDRPSVQTLLASLSQR
ncbi:uncharacterized protein PV07_02664 [Cladophialophora immunda]|uniref:Protein kinase domain-containing protein n=1 Tax=Cladophialophora immunda TaxID=569365 RepID=A0A0D2D5P6_9EURO|nr:uncharacterized protein PV07_02664 [Cladophialophora immunda]KIW30979.1 hypothetical protein PV07_02664 [Cladophialophora immunda]OQV05648.1 Protein kinase domain-containing protein [Cladophialophora immunda]